jgi:hypothetical protein
MRHHILGGRARWELHVPRAHEGVKLSQRPTGEVVRKWLPVASLRYTGVDVSFQQHS